MPSADFFAFVVNLVKLGGLGVGALIFVLAFVILIRNQPASADMAKFRLSFLRWGFAFAVLALVASSATDLVGVLKPSGKVQLGVTISPNFAEAKLPQPQLYLMPQGQLIQPNTSAELEGNETLSIQVLGIVESVKGLAQSSESLLAANTKLTDALDKSSQLIQSANAPGASPEAKAAAIAQIPALAPHELVQMHAVQSQVASGIASGNFAAAARNSATLQSMTVTSHGLNK